MQPLARDGYSADQVRAILTGDAISAVWGVDVLDLDGNQIGTLDDDSLACTVSRQMYADVHGTVDLTVARELDWPNVRVRPWQAVNDIRFDLGIFDLQTPEQTADTGVFEVLGMDLLSELQNIVGDTLWLGTNWFYVPVAATIATANSGVRGARALFDSTSSGVALAAPMVWALDPESPANYLRVVNDLLAAVGYRGVWADQSGIYRSEPYRTPAQRPVEWTFDLSDPATDIVAPDRSITTDNWQRVNWWRFLRRGTTFRPTEGAGLYTVDRSAGLTPVRAYYAFDASSQASLKAQGDRQVVTDSSRTRLIDITTGPLPCLGHFDIAAFRDPVLGDHTTQVRAWSQSLDGASVSVTLEVVD